jgi:hypothetical protein
VKAKGLRLSIEQFGYRFCNLGATLENIRNRLKKRRRSDLFVAEHKGIPV